MKDKLLLIGSLLAIISGALTFVFAITGPSDNMPVVILGIAIVFLGFILLVTSYITPSVAQSKEGVGLGYLIIIASILGFIGPLDFDALWILSVIGGLLIALGVVCMWPCFCCQGKGKKGRARHQRKRRWPYF